MREIGPIPINGLLRANALGRAISAILPKLGLIAYTPHQAAGIRTEPPPSLPWAIGTRPAATAAALPPDEPPAFRERSKGVLVAPET